MYAQLNNYYAQLASRLNILDKMNDELTEENSWTDSLNPLLFIDVDPATLNTPDKRWDIYSNFLNNSQRLRRMGPCGHNKQLHPNLLIAKVEYWIRQEHAKFNNNNF